VCSTPCNNWFSITWCIIYTVCHAHCTPRLYLYTCEAHWHAATQSAVGVVHPCCFTCRVFGPGLSAVSPCPPTIAHEAGIQVSHSHQRPAWLC
jgi:hypothetical protein